ncbi:GTPase-associated protein 1-related protein [Streptomyces sp. ISL-12]|uniref:GTPase-associated protein 1-related protein n=1 Tax=Streptomyces sp. ISL-12 TaxID=2819177 RepID=UPI0027E0CE85|nr:GTPase-associated protein 1-related protein [Streptomyces sp. ISL-12]
MSLAQLHYTSAPPGPDGSGFRFTAVSPGVPQGLLREAEQLIGYEPPRDLPARPDAAQLRDFPKALGFHELSDGGRLLSRTVYTGADYSGRWGNFHAHALYLPPGTRLPDGALPITAWESPRWADATPADRRPAPVDRLEPSGLLRRDALVAFAASRADRLAAFFADLRVLAEDPDACQVVLVEHDSAAVAQWIALACAVLPREVAHRLTFTTYTRRPQQARQQIVGALPSSEPCAPGHRLRVHDCTGRPASGSAGTVPDAWADTCARVWCAARPELFRDASLDLGCLAASALAAGVALRADARAAAARWAGERVGSLPEATLTALIGVLSASGGDEGGTSGTSSQDAGAERAALAALLDRVEGRLPTAVTAPLAGRVLTSAVFGGGPVPALRAGSLTPVVRDELARTLAAPLRSGIADPHEPAVGRPLLLLGTADLLDVDCQDLLPELAGRLSRALVAGPGGSAGGGEGGRENAAGAGGEGGAGSGVYGTAGTGAEGARRDASRGAAYGTAGNAAYGTAGTGAEGARRGAPHGTTYGTAYGTTDPAPDDLRQPGAARDAADPAGESDGCPPALLDAVEGHPALRIALFGALDALAAADPVAVSRRLAGSRLPVALQPGFPHLRMCVLSPEAREPGDRLTRFHGVLRAAAVSPHAEPAVLGTALHLVWPGELPTAQEASLLLNQLGSDIHRAAGTRDVLVDAALAAPPDDLDVPVLAADLLRCFPTELRPGQRAALLLLEFTGLLGTEGEGEEWVGRALGLRDGAAEPVPDTVTERVCAALARRLVDGPAPDSELYGLARSGEPRLLAAYERAGRSERVRDRLRTSPAYAAACFCAWSACPGTHPAWDETRTALLTKVLRPVVRALPAADLAGIEDTLGRAGGGRLDAFRSWNRPGTLGRLAGRFSGRNRRAERPPVRHGDIEPPAEEGRP